MMPAVFQGLQDLDEKRIKYVKHFMIQATDTEKNVYPIVNTCLEGILRAGNEIDDHLVSWLCENTKIQFLFERKECLF